MLQRSPSYVASLPSVDNLAEQFKRWLPPQLAHRLARWKGILIAMAFFRFCRRFPGPARRFLLGQVRKRLGDEQMRHFEPSYTPWDQRLCLVPDGDLFRTLKQGKAEVVTDTIETFTEQGVRLKSGRELSADLIVSATGLNLKFLGGVRFTIDGREHNPSQAIPYKGAMLSGFPNFGMTFGYTNASWTLKCDLIGEWLGRLLRYMKDHRLEVALPESSPPVEREPLIDFSSGYFQRAKDVLPSHGDRSPWRMHQNYFRDLHTFRWRPLADEGLHLS
jgi:cation diffusion facilitator CzcD-associated flavoprotein CzcO